MSAQWYAYSVDVAPVDGPDTLSRPGNVEISPEGSLGHRVCHAVIATITSLPIATEPHKTSTLILLLLPLAAIMMEEICHINQPPIMVPTLQRLNAEVFLEPREPRVLASTTPRVVVDPRRLRCSTRPSHAHRPAGWQRRPAAAAAAVVAAAAAAANAINRGTGASSAPARACGQSSWHSRACLAGSRTGCRSVPGTQTR